MKSPNFLWTHPAPGAGSNGRAGIIFLRTKSGGAETVTGNPVNLLALRSPGKVRIRGETNAKQNVFSLKTKEISDINTLVIHTGSCVRLASTGMDGEHRLPPESVRPKLHHN